MHTDGNVSRNPPLHCIKFNPLVTDLIQVFFGESTTRLEEVVESMEGTQLLHLPLMVHVLRGA